MNIKNYFFKLVIVISEKIEILYKSSNFRKIDKKGIKLKSTKPIKKGWYLLLFNYKNGDSRLYFSISLGINGFNQSRYFAAKKLKSRLVHIKKIDYLYCSIDNNNQNIFIKNFYLIRIPFLLSFFIIQKRFMKIFPDIYKLKTNFAYKWKLYNYFHKGGIRKTPILSYFNWILYFEKDFINKLNLIKNNNNKFFVQKSNKISFQKNGEWVFFLREGDLLTENSFEIIQFFLKNTSEECNVIFTDEDEIDDKGNRHNPNFKPAWNRELFLCSRQFGNSWIIKKDLWNMAINSISNENEKPTIFKILLNIIYFLETNKKINTIKHLPAIIYHNRKKIENNIDNNYLVEFINKKRDFFGTLNNIQISSLTKSNIFIWQCNKSSLLSIMIPFRDKIDLLDNCLNSIKKFSPGCNFEIFFIDNNSFKDETKKYLSNLLDDSFYGEKRKIISIPTEFNYSFLNNECSKFTNGDVLLLLNNDIEFLSAKWGYFLTSNALRPGIGCVGAKLLYKDNSVQHGGIILGIGKVAGHAHRFYKSEEKGYQGRLNTSQEFSALTGACLAISKKNWLSLKGLNEKDLKINYNDVDLGLRCRSIGLRNLYIPHVVAYHLESKTRGAPIGPQLKQWISEKNYMVRNWPNYLKSDPSYSPHLSLNNENFDISINQLAKVELRNGNLIKQVDK